MASRTSDPQRFGDAIPVHGAVHNAGYGRVFDLSNATGVGVTVFASTAA